MALQFPNSNLSGAGYQGGGSQGGFTDIAETYKQAKIERQVIKARSVLSGQPDADDRNLLQRAADKVKGVEYTPMDENTALQTLAQYDPKTYEQIQTRSKEMEEQDAENEKQFNLKRDALGKDSLKIIDKLTTLKPEERAQYAPAIEQGLKDKYPDFADRIKIDLNNDGTISDDELTEARSYLSAYDENADQYEPVKDEKGNIIGQKNLKTGKVETDPRAKGNDSLSTSGPERMIQKVIDLESKPTRTAAEERELDLVKKELAGQRTIKTVDGEGFVWSTDAIGNTIQVKNPETGEPLKDMAAVREGRIGKYQEQQVAKQLNEQFDRFAKPSMTFLTNTQAIESKTGRESIDDNQLSYMYARTLDPSGAEVSKTDLSTLATTGSVPERIGAAIRGAFTGKPLPTDIRKEMEQAVQTARKFHRQNIRQNIEALEAQASSTGITDFSPTGASKGSQYNPIRVTSDDDVQKTEIGDWLEEPDGSIFQRKK